MAEVMRIIDGPIAMLPLGVVLECGTLLALRVEIKDLF